MGELVSVKWHALGNERRLSMREDDMSLSDLSRFRNELVHITEQIRRLAEHRAPILEASTVYDLDGALERLAHSMNILKACVAGLQHRLKPRVTWPEE